MGQYVIHVGLKCYGARDTLEEAIERAQFWEERHPGTAVTVRYQEVMWSNEAAQMLKVQLNRSAAITK